MDMATPDSMLGSHSASNEVADVPSACTLKSVSGRPLSNPLFEAHDTASRHEVRWRNPHPILIYSVPYLIRIKLPAAVYLNP